jgi:hypothetical protein
MLSSFFVLTSICLTLNLVYYFYKKRGYTSFKIKYIILVGYFVIIFFFLSEFPLFLLQDSDYVLENFTYYIAEVFSFNIAVIFFCCSIILYLLNCFKIDKSLIELEVPSYKASQDGSIKIGRILKRNSKKYNFFLSINDLAKHVFICGSTGTGKSNFMQNILINITNQLKKPFFLVEFKGEYHFLQENIKDLIILWPGENFSINLFDPLGANPKIHAERIFDIIRSGQFLDDKAEYSPQMERVLIDILTKVCENKDLRSWEGFQECCTVYLKEEKDNVPFLKQTLISLNNRIRRFAVGPMRAVFDSNSRLTVSQLFNKKAILDLSSIIRLGGEKEDALFFLNMVLKYLWDRNLTRGATNYDGINHITIIEDAQYFAPQGLTKKSKLTSYLEDIALLQRGTGECLITIATRPNISKEILANNGVVVTFKNHIEKDIMCELLNLESEKKSYLSIIDEGQCIIRVNSIKEPFLLGIPYINRNSLTVSEIYRKNEMILDKQQKNIDLLLLDSHKSNNQVIHNDSKIKILIFKAILRIKSIRNKLKIDKHMDSKEIDDSDRSFNNDLVNVVNNDDSSEFGNYIKKLYTDQEENK